MSKELEALLDKLTTKQIAIDLFNIVSNGKYDMNDLVYYFDRIDDALAELEELKRDPMAEEVCEALREYFGFDYYYQDNFFYRSNGIKYVYPLKVSGFVEIQLYDGHLPPHLITLIGRFYDGVEE